MEDKAKTKRRTYDPGFKERAVQMAAESRNIAETGRTTQEEGWRGPAQLLEVTAYGALGTGVVVVFDQFLPHPAGGGFGGDFQQGRDHIDQPHELSALSRRSKGIDQNLGGHLRITLNGQDWLRQVIRGVRRRIIPGGHRWITLNRLPLPTELGNGLGVDVGRFTDPTYRPSGRQHRS